MMNEPADQLSNEDLSLLVRLRGFESLLLRDPIDLDEIEDDYTRVVWGAARAHLLDLKAVLGD